LHPALILGYLAKHILDVHKWTCCFSFQASMISPIQNESSFYRNSINQSHQKRSRLSIENLSRTFIDKSFPRTLRRESKKLICTPDTMTVRRDFRFNFASELPRSFSVSYFGSLCTFSRDRDSKRELVMRIRAEIRASVTWKRGATYFGKVRDPFSPLSDVAVVPTHRSIVSSGFSRAYPVKRNQSSGDHAAICSSATSIFAVGAESERLKNSPEIYTLSHRSKWKRATPPRVRASVRAFTCNRDPVFCSIEFWCTQTDRME